MTAICRTLQGLNNQRLVVITPLFKGCPSYVETEMPGNRPRTESGDRFEANNATPGAMLAGSP